MSMTLDNKALGLLYAPFEPTEMNSGWNFTNSTTGRYTAYFLSQGTEYYFDEPTTSLQTSPIGGGVIGSPLLGSLVSLAALITQIAEGTGQYQSQVQSLNDWVAQVQTGTPVDILTVSGHAVNVQNNQGDDKAALEYFYILCPVLGPNGLALPVQHTATIDWSGSLKSTVLATLSFGKDAGVYASMAKVCMGLAEAAGEAIPGVDVIATIGLACSLALTAAKHISTDGDTNGRLNFLGVLTHSLVRVSSCISPNSTPVAQVPCIQGATVGPAWANSIFEFTVEGGLSAPMQEGVYFGTYPGDTFMAPYASPLSTLYAQPYHVNVPEQSWLLGGALTYATAMTFSNSTEGTSGSDTELVFALACLVYTAGGYAVSTIVQCTQGDPQQLPPPSATTWYQYAKGTNIDTVFQDAVAGAVSACDAATVPSLQLQFVVPPLLQSMVNGMEMLSGTGVQPSSKASITLSDSQEIDSGNAPAVAVKVDGTVIAVYDDNSTNVNTHLHWAYGNLTSNGAQVTWNNADDNPKYEEGSWPALSINPGPYTAGLDNDVLELHDYSSSLWWEAGAVDESKKNVSFGDRTEMNDGHNAGLFIAPNGLALILFANGSDLAYNTGYFDQNGNLTPYQSDWTPSSYLTNVSGGYPTVISSGSNVLEVHNDSGDLYFNVGTISSDNVTIDWGHGPFPFMFEGSHPHLACFESGLVVLTYDNNNQLYAALGQIVNGTMVWFVTNLNLNGGQYPAICCAPNFAHNFVMCFNDTNGHIFSQTGVANFPTAVVS